jgi:hypothetical protein
MTSILPFEETDLGRALLAVAVPLNQIQNVLHSEVPENGLRARIGPLAEQSISSLQQLDLLILQTQERYRREHEELIEAVLHKLESVREMQGQQLSELIDVFRIGSPPFTRVYSQSRK